ncbi:choice-of-anchor A family protein, partial [Streptomyces pacificus]|uniref:choice-of-anchor A family protein n=1 Tax=Streptomyces pacificus TaxID=2705029 RepID=UPI0015676631
MLRAAAMAGCSALLVTAVCGGQAAAAARVPVVIGNPVAGSNGFGVVTEGDATLGSTESEGPVAIGGDLTIGDNYNVALHTTGTFVAPGDAEPTALLVDGAFDLGGSSAGGVLRVLQNGYVKIGDMTGSQALIEDMNGASVNTRVVADGAPYESTPRIELTTQQQPASVAQGGLLDFAELFAQYRDRSDLMADCASTVPLLDPNGNPIPDPGDIPPGSNIAIALTAGQTNVLRLTGEQLINIAVLTFLNPPTEDTPLVVTVDTTGDGGQYSWTTPVMAGVSGLQAPYILWNFADATEITIQSGDTLEGTVYAPRAALTDLAPSNIEGDIITRELVAGTVSANAGEIHYFPFDADLTCDTGTQPTTGEVRVLKVDAESGEPLGGATFELWRESNGVPGLQTGGVDPDTAVGGSCVTGADGVCAREVGLGEYYWLETVAPAGYELPVPSVFGPLVLTVDNAGVGVSVTARNVPERVTGTVRVVKVDAESGEPLGGATFELWRESNGVPGLQTGGVDPDTAVGGS